MVLRYIIFTPKMMTRSFFKFSTVPIIFKAEHTAVNKNTIGKNQKAIEPYVALWDIVSGRVNKNNIDGKTTLNQTIQCSGNNDFISSFFDRVAFIKISFIAHPFY